MARSRRDGPIATLIYSRYMVDQTDTAFSGTTDALPFSRHAVFVDTISFVPPAMTGGRGDLTIAFRGEPTFPINAGYNNGADTRSEMISDTDARLRVIGPGRWEVDLSMSLRCDGVDTAGVGSTASVTDMAGIRGETDFHCS